MPNLVPARQALAGSIRYGKVWTLQIIVNPILFVLLVLWLQIPVATIWELILNGALALMLAILIIVFHTGTLNYFVDETRHGSAAFVDAFRRSFRNLIPTSICVAAFSAIWLLVASIDFDTDREIVPTYLRSILPVFARRHISLESVTGLFDGTIFGLRWILIPGLMLPVLLFVADAGFRGLRKDRVRSWLKMTGSFSYWVILIAAAILGVFATSQIMGYTPDFQKSTLRSETISLIVRFSIAYLLAVFAWMLTFSLMAQLGSQGEGNSSSQVAGKSGA